MARETWLRPNRRVLALGLILPSLLVVGGPVAVWFASNLIVAAVGWALLTVGAYVMALMLYALRQPRLAYEHGELLVYLTQAGPIRVSIDIVECFFGGQGPSFLSVPGAEDDDSAPETATVVVRLAESAEDWKHVTVKPALGHWCDGYITVRGTWCEPLTSELVQGLNDRLVRAQRQLRAREEKEPA